MENRKYTENISINTKQHEYEILTHKKQYKEITLTDYEAISQAHLPNFCQTYAEQ
jgi:hypothetical protein